MISRTPAIPAVKENNLSSLSGDPQGGKTAGLSRHHAYPRGNPPIREMAADARQAWLATIQRQCSLIQSAGREW